MSESKVVLISGANRGLGLATADLLASAGYVVYAGQRKASQGDELVLKAKDSNGCLRPIELDVTKAYSIKTACERIVTEAGRIDILINNACLVYWGTSETCTIDEQMKSMDVNYFGAVRMLQEVLPIMRKSRSGLVINISSIAGFEAYPGIETYVASKFALEGLSESLAIYLDAWGVDIAVVEPGNVKTRVAFNSSVGSRQVVDTPALNRYAEQALASAIDYYHDAQDPYEVAELIKGICENRNKIHLRYQTSPSARQRAKLRSRDPDGDSLITEKKQLLARNLKELLD